VDLRARPPLRPACLAVDFLRVLVDLRVEDFLRPVFLRAAALPPLRPACTTDGALRVVFLRPVDLRVVAFLRVPVDLRAVDFLRVVDFFRPDVLRAVARPPLRPAWTTDGALRVLFLRPVDLRVVDFRVPVDLRAVDFLRPVVLRAVARPPLRPAAARVVDFLRVPVLLRVVDFLRVPVVLRAVLFLPVAFLRPDDDFLLAVDFRGVEELVFRVVLRVELLRRTGLRVETPESVPNTSEAVPAAPVSMVRVVGAKSSSEPDTTTPPPSRSPPIGSSRVGSIDPVSSAMTPLSVEFFFLYKGALPFIATNKQSFNETLDD
jgi:hypothetical protein